MILVRFLCNIQCVLLYLSILYLCLWWNLVYNLLFLLDLCQILVIRDMPVMRGNCSTFLYFLQDFVKIWHFFLLKCLIDFTSKTIWAWTFLCGKVFDKLNSFVKGYSDFHLLVLVSIFFFLRHLSSSSELSNLQSHVNKLFTIFHFSPLIFAESVVLSSFHF